MTYKVNLELFEGPLDLLLYLIKKNDLDINEISISEITNEYLEYVKALKLLNIEIAGEFLIIAATLLHIKSKRVLPEENNTDEETIEDLESDLKNRLLEYNKFKEVSILLKEKEEAQINFHERGAISLANEDIEYDLQSNIFELVNAFKIAYKKAPDNIKEIEAEPISVEDKIQEIQSLLLENDFINLNELFKDGNKLEIIVTFLALLELIKINKIIARQSHLFGDIRIYKQVEIKVTEVVS